MAKRKPTLKKLNEYLQEQGQEEKSSPADKKSTSKAKPTSKEEEEAYLEEKPTSLVKKAEKATGIKADKEPPSQKKESQKKEAAPIPSQASASKPAIECDSKLKELAKEIITYSRDNELEPEHVITTIRLQVEQDLDKEQHTNELVVEAQVSFLRNMQMANDLGLEMMKGLMNLWNPGNPRK